MNTVTAKQLKQKTGEVIRRVRSGERLTVTYRGKPVAVIASSTDRLSEPVSFNKAWKDIEEAMTRTEPEFKGWQEAIGWVRRRI